MANPRAVIVEIKPVGGGVEAEELLGWKSRKTVRVMRTYAALNIASVSSCHHEDESGAESRTDSGFQTG